MNGVLLLSLLPVGGLIGCLWSQAVAFHVETPSAAMSALTEAAWSRQTEDEVKHHGKLVVQYRDTDDERSAFVIAAARSSLKAFHKGDLKVSAFLVVVSGRLGIGLQNQSGYSLSRVLLAELLGGIKANGGRVPGQV